MAESQRRHVKKEDVVLTIELLIPYGVSTLQVQRIILEIEMACLLAKNKKNM
jgi:hypothetical protein